MARESGAGEGIEELETRIAYQDRTIEKLDELISDHERRIDALERSLSDLGPRLGLDSGEQQGGGSGATV